jgi:Ca2+-dependent lipid-binding protein
MQIDDAQGNGGNSLHVDNADGTDIGVEFGEAFSTEIVEAKLKRDTETFGKMDPYVIICTRMQRVRTKTANNAGKHPKWKGESIDIDVKYVGDDLTMQVFDEDVTSSDLIGETTIKLSSLCVGTGFDDWFQIQYKGKEAGTVHLISEWKPTGMQLQQRDPNERLPPPVVVFSNGQPAQHNAKDMNT